MIATLEPDPSPAARLQDRLADPEVARSVHELLDMAPDLAGAAKLLIGFVRRSSQIAENVNGIVDTARSASAGPDGKPGAGIAGIVELKDQIGRALAVVDQLQPLLAKPETMESLRTLVDSLPKIMAMLRIFELFIARSSDMAENFNGVVDTFRTAINKRWKNDNERQRIAELPGRLMDTIESEALHRLLDSYVLSKEGLDVLDGLLRSGAFSPEALDLVGRVAELSVKAETDVRATDARVGPMGMLRAIGDPDVQRGIAFALDVARKIGAQSNARKAAG